MYLIICMCCQNTTFRKLMCDIGDTFPTWCNQCCRYKIHERICKAIYPYFSCRH